MNDSREHVVWLPGWASNLQNWASELALLLPARKHSIISHADLLLYQERPWEIPQIQKADCVVGWSLGGAQALRAYPNLPLCKSLFLIAPAVWFCHPKFGWNKRILQNMQKRLAANPQKVLEDFALALGPCPLEVQKQWVTLAQIMPLAELQQGLEILMSECYVPIPPHFSTNITILQGDKDSIVSLEHSLWLKEELPESQIIIRKNCGHWLLPGPWL